MYTFARPALGATCWQLKAKTRNNENSPLFVLVVMERSERTETPVQSLDAMDLKRT